MDDQYRDLPPEALTPGTPLGLLTNAVQTLAGVLLWRWRHFLEIDR